MAATPHTYPGTVSPVRGLAPYGEADRDVFFGRDHEVQGLARMVTQDGVRAALLVGEHGVGKTSLLAAGLGPYLKDHGVLVVSPPTGAGLGDALMRDLAEKTRMPPKQGEKPADYLARVISSGGQLVVIVLDDIDAALARDDGHLAAELAELFQRVTTRGGGRARFLFSVTDQGLHHLDALEKRTGSLFPPPTRFRLGRLNLEQAVAVAERTMALMLIGGDISFPTAVAQGLVAGEGVRPADLQLALMSIKQLGLGHLQQLQTMGGPEQVINAWLRKLAGELGPEQQVLRLLGVLGEQAPPRSAAGLAMRADVSPQLAEKVLGSLTQPPRMLLVAGQNAEGATTYAPASAMLAPRLALLGAAARAAAADARAALQVAAQSGRSLSAKQVARIKEVDIEPTGQAEISAMAGPRRRRWPKIAAIAAVPVLLLVILYASLGGKAYTAHDGAGSAERMVLRTGRPGLKAFFWLPHSPRYGSVAVDLGLTREMVSPGAWQDSGRVTRLDAGSGVHSTAGDLFVKSLEPHRGGALAFVLQGDDALDEVSALMKQPGDVVTLFAMLAPVAQGGPKEVALVGVALGDPSPAARRAGLGVALAAASRGVTAYDTVLAKALSSSDSALRSAARAGLGELPAESRSRIQARALEQADEGQRAELVALMGGGGSAPDPAADARMGAALLSAPVPSQHARGKELLTSALAKAPDAAVKALLGLALQDSAPAAVRVEALTLLAPLEAKVLAAVGDDLIKLLAAQEPTVGKAALPLAARVAPEKTLAGLGDAADAPPEVRAARAVVWGELAASKPAEAQAALESLLDDKSPMVRAAAARAYGKLGKLAVEKLGKLTKGAGGELASAAGWGLVATLSGGASSGEVASGIGQLWKRKGAAKRDAARMYAALCAQKPNAFVGYAASAARDRDDAGLGPIGVEGLCQALGAGAAKQALPGLRGALDSESAVTRIAVADCIASRAELVGEAGAKLLQPLLKAEGEDERRAAARALAAIATGDKQKLAVTSLLGLLGDPSREVRTIAAAGLGAAKEPPAADVATKALIAAWARADAAEKPALLAAAIAAGIPDVVTMALADLDAQVRAGALAGVGLLPQPAAALGAAIADPDPRVRAAALTRLATPGVRVDATELARSLELAIYGDDPAAATAALSALAHASDTGLALDALARQLARPEASARAAALIALSQLAAQSGPQVEKLALPALADPAREVRVAAVFTIAAVRSGQGPTKLIPAFTGAESDATARLIALEALLMSPESAGALGKVAKDGPPMARLWATVGVALLNAKANGPGFVSFFVP